MLLFLHGFLTVTYTQAFTCLLSIPQVRGLVESYAALAPAKKEANRTIAAAAAAASGAAQAKRVDAASGAAQSAAAAAAAPLSRTADGCSGGCGAG